MGTTVTPSSSAISRALRVSNSCWTKITRALSRRQVSISYFARDYGLKQISIEEGGKEPSPTHLKELIETCRRMIDKESGIGIL